MSPYLFPVLNMMVGIIAKPMMTPLKRSSLPRRPTTTNLFLWKSSLVSPCLKAPHPTASSLLSERPLSSATPSRVARSHWSLLAPVSPTTHLADPANKVTKCESEWTAHLALIIHFQHLIHYL